MKKFILSGALVLATIITLITLTPTRPARAVTPIYKSFFIANAQNLYITNNVTITNGLMTSNSTTAAACTNYWYVGGQQITNIIAGAASVNTNFANPQIFTVQQLWSDMNGLVTTPTISVTVNSTNVMLPLEDNNLFQNTNKFAPIITPGASSTNTATFVYLRGNGPRNNIHWDYANPFTFNIAGPGAFPVCIMTNAPAAFYQGAMWIGLYTVTTSTASGSTGLVISDTGIAGFIP